jgi:hypothetical protein
MLMLLCVRVCVVVQVEEVDYYTQLKVLQRQVEFLDIQV